MKKALLILALLAANVWAQGAPATVSFVARLQDSGLPLMGSHDFVFALYDQPTGGSNYWQETRNGVALQDGGLLYLDLGTVTPLTASVFAGNARYLEITIDGTVSTPRVLIESVPYALHAGKASDADALQGHPSAFFQQTVQSTCSGLGAIQTINADGSVTCATPPTYTAGTGLSLAGGIFSVDFTTAQQRVTGTCATGAINLINANGTVTCATIPNYTAGSGISINASNQIGVDFTVAQHALTSACLAGGILNTFTAGGASSCYGLATGGGLAFASGNYSVDTTVIEPKITAAAVKSTTPISTTSQTYVGTGVSINATIPASGNAMITVTAMVNPAPGGAYVSFTGGGVSASDSQALFVSVQTQASATFYVTGLSTGVQTFSASVHQVGAAGTTSLSNVQLTVLPLP